MKKTGEILKVARENKNLSLHEIGMSLKINPKILQAIEDGDTARLPAQTFLRGFIKSYAQFLKMDPGPVLTTFQEEIGGIRSEPKSIKPTPEPSIAAPPVASPTVVKSVPPAAQPKGIPAEAWQSNRLIVAISAVIVLVVVVLVSRAVNKYQKERNLDHTKIAETQNQTKPLVAPPAVVAPESGVETMTSASAAAPGLPVEETKLTPPVSPLPIVSQVAPPRQTPVDLVPQKHVPEKPEGLEKPVPPSAKPQEVILEALDKVKISYSIGDGNDSTIELGPDEIHTFKSNTRISLEISDGGSVGLIVNGRDKGVPGKIGIPIKLSYPK